MRRYWYGRLLIITIILATILGTGFGIKELQASQNNQLVSTGDVSNTMVIPGGMPIGIYMKTDGVLVLGTDAVVAKDGKEYRPAGEYIKSGDYIVEINDISVDSKKSLIDELKNLKSKEVTLKIRRNEEEMTVNVTAVETKNHEFKLGIWVRDSVQGLGTVTYITQNSEFGALGHGIHDADTDGLLEMKEGKIYNTQIVNIEKGKKGTPGGMEGMIIYNKRNILGSIEHNTDNGVYGNVQNVNAITGNANAIPICTKRAVKTGEATIRCCVDGTIKDYDIEILKINYFSLTENKAILIKVVDEELLKITGGIVQGMSGSPILQDGKIVGAVTHVFVNDPTRGYGIFIEDMLKQ